MIVFEKQLHWYFLSAWNEGIITIIVIKKHHLLLAVPHDCFHRLISNHLILHCSITSISLGRPLHRYYSLRSSHCVKSVQIQSFFLVHIFPHSDWIRCGVSHRIQSECGKARTRKNFVFGHVSRSESSRDVLQNKCT